MRHYRHERFRHRHRPAATNGAETQVIGFNGWGNAMDVSVDTAAIEDPWAKVGDQIRSLVEKNPELKAMIDNLRKA
jgi:hypothetical protein